jgi:hypothetical protein
LAVAARAKARSLALKRARPGGRARAFCEPVRRTSMSSSSMGMGSTLKDETVSTMRRTSGNSRTTAAISSIGLMTPVEVSL